ncbi:MAG: peptidase E [Actinomycetota bacterium]
MTARHIVAMGGGQDVDDPVFDYVASLLDAPRPKVCLLPTAQSAVPLSVMRLLSIFPADRFEPTYLDLFARDDRDLREVILSQDLVFVGGGNTANLLAVWRVHGMDAILREAWESGVVLAGGSAGANCWFEASTTDSFGPLAPLLDGVGLLPGSFCPHYANEPSRRPLYHRLVADGFPAGIACDDLAAVHFEDSEIAGVVSSHPDARAYRVAQGDDGQVEERPLSADLPSSAILTPMDRPLADVRIDPRTDEGGA